ncbi:MULTISPECIES: GxxExxY protein [Prevotella]|jgi:hypothetical protein|uniref:GxxExxY protein n=1 Tax=Prevotella TaxID=838 RepID=UPI000D1E3097|nr:MULTISPECIES: GxxExxY protein [Prevotella]PTL29937.1 GxxExxY protein [Prevotella sp. oral taxon 313]QUB82144.1 GxxExxY protein [Prevotella jejuni]
MKENDITYRIIGAIYKVYRALGPGLLESIYEEALTYQLVLDGLKVERQVNIPIIYQGKELADKLKLDILVEDQIIVELKAVKELLDVHYKQLLTYLKLANLHIGLLVNFQTANIQNEIHRVINGYR